MEPKVFPQVGKQSLAMHTEVDVLFFGGARGAGKSRLLLMKPLLYAHDDPNFHGIFFRRQTDNLTGAGGLWPEGCELYEPFKPQVRLKDLKWTFPIGSTIKCKHMELEQSKESHRGLQYSYIGWDELDQFSESQFTFLLASLRSKARGNSFTVATMNPNPDSWIVGWIEWYLDDDGQPREDRCGAVRHFVVINNKPVFGDSEQEIVDKYPDSVWVSNPKTGKSEYVRPKTFTFINGTVFDNPELIRLNPSYLAELNNLPEIDKKRNLFGNWYARPVGSQLFLRSWVKEVFSYPVDAKCVRAWDKAYTEPNDKNPYPDYSACIKVYKCTKGYYYLVGDYDPTCCDDNADIKGRFRKRFGERNQKMLQQAHFDGNRCTVAIPKESGAGKGEFEQLVKMFSEAGFNVVGMETGNAKGAKVERFSVFSSLAQNGMVYLVRNSFNDATYNALMSELEAFDGTGSTGKIKDDWVDAVSDAVLSLQKVRVHKPFTLPSVSAPTLLANHRRHM